MWRMIYEQRLTRLVKDALKRVWRFGVRMDVAAVLIVLVLLAAALGSCFPQLSSSTMSDTDRWTRWETDTRVRYGALTDALVAGGVFRWFQSPVFLISLALLTVATLACALDRWPRVWRRVFRQSVRCPDLVFEAAPHTVSLAAPPNTSLVHVIQAKLESRGFRVRSEAADGSVYVRGDRNRFAPLATLLNHLAVLLLLLGAVLSSGYGWREEWTIGPGATIQVGHESGVALRHEGFTITRYPDGNVAAYEAQVAVIQNGRIDRCNVRVNGPLSYNGIGFSLQGFRKVEDSYEVTLLAVYDPGYGVVIAAGLLLLLGLAMIFHFPYCCVRARIGADGGLRLAGEAGRYASDFEREFATLVQEIERAMGGEREKPGC